MASKLGNFQMSQLGNFNPPSTHPEPSLPRPSVFCRSNGSYSAPRASPVLKEYHRANVLVRHMPRHMSKPAPSVAQPPIPVLFIPLEPRPSNPEPLQRQAKGRAILALIELASRSPVMMKPPKRLSFHMPLLAYPRPHPLCFHADFTVNGKIDHKPHKSIVSLQHSYGNCSPPWQKGVAVGLGL